MIVDENSIIKTGLLVENTNNGKIKTGLLVENTNNGKGLLVENTNKGKVKNTTNGLVENTIMVQAFRPISH